MSHCCPPDDHSDHQSSHQTDPHHQTGTHHQAGIGASDSYLRKFFIVTVLLLPLFFFSDFGLKLIGLADFPLRQYLEPLIATAIFSFGLIFFQHAKHEIKMKQYGMMTLVSLGVGTGYLFSLLATFIPQLQANFYLEISTLIWVLLFGHFLEAKSTAAAGDALQAVAKLLPKNAHLIKNNQTVDVPVQNLKINDLILIKPGEKVPADGKIINGRANFNQAHLTGESKPVEKNINDPVVAGSICLDSSVKVKITRIGANSTVGQIQTLVAQAKDSKPTAQRLADKAAKWLTFTALTVSVLSVSIWFFVLNQSFVFALTLAITVLVIACPHALGLAIPAVSTIATKLAVKNGLFVKDLAKLEIIRNIDYVVFDKTGTLTQGEFGVNQIVPVAKTSVKDILKIVASLEKQSSHVIGQSIVKHAKTKRIKLSSVSEFKNLAGQGITGSVGKKPYFVGNLQLMKQKKLLNKPVETEYEKLSAAGQTVILLADSRQILGLIALGDQVKNQSQSAIAQLHDLGVKVAMLTGDNKSAASLVAQKLKIDTVFAETLPKNKYEKIKILQAQGNKVMMVGDGVNDAPALTQADVGVAIGAGTDVAVESGDVVLTQNNPADITKLILLARKVYRKMIENLIWALGYNLLAIPAAAGLFIPLGIRLRPNLGALMMSLSSVIVVINAMTLKKVQLNKPVSN